MKKMFLEKWNIIRKKIRNMKFSFVHGTLFLILFLLITYLLIPIDRFEKHSKDEITWGASFSSDYAESLGLNANEIYEKMLEEINIDSIRLPIYWDRIEREKGNYDFRELDWQMDLAHKYNKSVILAIGYKIPRWPECRKPNWASFEPVELQNQVENLIIDLVNRYKNHEALLAWQLENEPYFDFGDCIEREDGFLINELELVKALDKKHDVIITDSGELSLWQKASNTGAEILGFTTYRKVYNPIFGYFTWFLSSDSYRKKSNFVGEDIKDVYAMELQVEPWHENFVGNVTLEEQKEIFTLNEIQESLDFGANMGFSHTYLWGVEWWYYLEQTHNYPDVKNLVIDFLK